MRKMIDFNDLSDQEIAKLEKQLAEYRKSERALKGHKVTFAFLYNPNLQKGSIYEDTLEDPESLAEEISNLIYSELEERFNLTNPQCVCDFQVVPMSSSEVKALRLRNLAD